MNHLGLIRDLVAFVTGFVCLILAVFSSYWFFLPIVVMTLWLLVGNRIQYTPGRDEERVVLYDSYKHPLEVKVRAAQKAKWGIRWNKEDSD